MARISSAERSARTRTTSTASAQQTRTISRTGTKKHRESSVSSRGRLSSSVPASAQQPKITSPTHTNKYLQSPESPQDSQWESPPTSYQPCQLQRRSVSLEDSPLHSQSPSQQRQIKLQKRQQSSILPDHRQDSHPTGQLHKRLKTHHSQPRTLPHTHTRPLQPSTIRSETSRNNIPPSQRSGKHEVSSPLAKSSFSSTQSSSFPPSPKQSSVCIFVHTSAPTSISQDARYRRQAAAVLRGFEGSTRMSLSPVSFGLPTYKDGESIPDRQVDPRDAWMGTANQGPATCDEDLEAMLQRYDKPRVAITPKLVRPTAKMVEVEVGPESSPEEMSEEDGGSQQHAQRREKLPSPRSSQYSSLGFLLPDIQSWETPRASIPESHGSVGQVEVPSSPILPVNMEVEEIDCDEIEMHIPSSQPGESATGVAVAHAPHTGFPEIFTGDLTSPEFLTSESMKEGRRPEAGHSKGWPPPDGGRRSKEGHPKGWTSIQGERGSNEGKPKRWDDAEQAALSSPAYQVLRESAAATPAPQRALSEIPPTSTPIFQGNKRKREREAQTEVQARIEGHAEPGAPSRRRQISREATPTPAPRAASTRSHLKRLPRELPVPSANGNTAKGKSRSQIILNAPELKLSQLKSASAPTSGRYLTRSHTQRQADTALIATSSISHPAVPPFTTAPASTTPRATSLPAPTTPTRLRGREFLYNIPAPPPLTIHRHSPPSQLSHPSTTSSLPLTNLPPFSPTAPRIPALSTLVPQPHIILPPDPSPHEVNTNPPQVTSYLARLEEKPHTWAPYFKPSYKTRELRQWERGSWVVDLSNSSSSLPMGEFVWQGGKEKIKFWEKLRGNVETGRLGMVGLFLGEDSEGGEEGNGADILKIYCWGGVAELVWAFLFVVSNRRTKLGLKWVDAAGKVVVQC